MYSQEVLHDIAQVLEDPRQTAAAEAALSAAVHLLRWDQEAVSMGFRSLSRSDGGGGGDGDGAGGGGDHHAHAPLLSHLRTVISHGQVAALGPPRSG